jgi:hypothetical protein
MSKSKGETMTTKETHDYAKDFTVYTADHLNKAHDIVSHEFWEMHEKLREPYTTRGAQMVDVAELARLGTLLTKIADAKSAVSDFVGVRSGLRPVKQGTRY